MNARQMSIAESLQEYAARTGRTPEQAYAEWHAHGRAISQAWRKPFFVYPSHDFNGDPMPIEHVTLGGGVLGLRRSDLDDLAKMRSSVGA